MPWLKALPTWLALNNCNFSSPSAITDPITGQPVFAGGLNLGDYTDFDNDTALTHSYTTNGILYEGRYRFVQVDSGATAANVRTGTVGYARSGSTVKTAVTTAAGSGGTTGSYNINATAGSGGGSGAIISITVSSGAIVGNPSVVNPGVGYVSPPSFNVNTSTTGLSGASVLAQLGCSVNIVTSADVALGSSGTPSATQAGLGPIHPVVFLNSITPGNYGFVQENGVATVLSGNVTQTINPWNWVFNPVGSQVGLVNIELGQSTEPAVEEEVLTDIASYGKQLGRIEDALLVLLEHFRPDRELTAAERSAIHDFKSLVAAVKAKHRSHALHKGSQGATLTPG